MQPRHTLAGICYNLHLLFTEPVLGRLLGDRRASSQPGPVAAWRDLLVAPVAAGVVRTSTRTSELPFIISGHGLLRGLSSAQ